MSYLSIISLVVVSGWVPTITFANISIDAGPRNYLCISMFNMWTCSDRNTVSGELQFVKYYLNLRKCETGKARSTSKCACSNALNIFVVGCYNQH